MALSSFRPHYLMPGVSCPKRTGGITWGLLCLKSWRNHWGISSSHCLQKGGAIQALSSLLMPPTISSFDSPSWLSSSSLPDPFLSTNSFLKVSTPLTKITVLLPYGTLPPTRYCLVQRLQWGWTCFGEVWTWLLLAPQYWDLHSDSLWGEDDCPSLFWLGSDPGVKEDWEVFSLEGG